MKEREKRTELQQNFKPLGPRHLILGLDRNKFKKILQNITGENIEDNLKSRKPHQWRNHFVRIVCSSEGPNGEEIRKLWEKVYRGDLRFGVRDARLKEKEKNWPRRDSKAYSRNQDRNSWIAASLLKALITQARNNVKNSYIKNM